MWNAVYYDLRSVNLTQLNEETYEVLASNKETKISWQNILYSD